VEVEEFSQTFGGFLQRFIAKVSAWAESKRQSWISLLLAPVMLQSTGLQVKLIRTSAAFKVVVQSSRSVAFQ
jgi:hypothetical protein